MGEVFVRLTSIRLKEAEQKDAYPILTTNSLASNVPEANKETVIEIVLNELPTLDNSVPWEHILEFRSDPDSFGKFLAIRNWMNEVSRNQLTPLEIEQKLEYLINQYRSHMELHKMKINAGKLETIIVSSAEFLEDLMKVKWGNIAKGLFSFRQKKIAMLEGELTSPGSEVAYIVKAQDTF
jgi:hypothetical protein